VEHQAAFTFVVIAGLLMLTLLSVLLLYQGRLVVASLQAIRAELTHRSKAAAAALGPTARIHRGPRASDPFHPRKVEATRDSDALPARPMPRAPRPANEDTDETAELDHDEAEAFVDEAEAFVTIQAFDAEGNPHPKSISLEVLLRAVGICPEEPEPGLAVLANAQGDLGALAELASRIEGEPSVNVAELGWALENIHHRLDLVAELFDPIRAGVRRSAEEPAGAPERAPPTSEPSDRAETPTLTRST
jgi:hypothetical protein